LAIFKLFKELFSCFPFRVKRAAKLHPFSIPPNFLSKNLNFFFGRKKGGKFNTFYQYLQIFPAFPERTKSNEGAKVVTFSFAQHIA
jgi:hypothetical protein